MTYRLDDLGWYQFERLIQALLKAELGLGVEAWAGHTDVGRDAYCSEPLCYPDRLTQSEGPFVFQAKYVRGATAAGAEPMPSLHQATAKEAKRIARRLETNTWSKPPTQYVLLTNVSMTRKRRKDIEVELSESLPNCNISIQGADDISALLDNHPFLRLSFPELMGVRDLQELLNRSMDRVISQRSEIALNEARELASVFVVTSAYKQSLSLLHENGFVVIDGPPEVGKTAIARMIGLAMATTGWELVDCRWPEDVLQKYDSDIEQVFVVDDVLGRTEYHSEHGYRWETELPTVLRLVDAGHWLIWTSRKHILVRGLERMDLNERSKLTFSNATSTVDAELLTETERTRMLYRHAKPHSASVRRLIRTAGRRIVENPSFTPERLRRFVSLAAELVDDTAEGQDVISEAIRASLTLATDSTHKVFQAFPESPRWILIAAAELGDKPTVKQLYRRSQAHRRLLSTQEFARHLDLLDGSFLKRSKVIGKSGNYDAVDWAHPTYRDVVIEQISRDWELQFQFWQNASPKALGIAFSEVAGTIGHITWPWATCPSVFDKIEQMFLKVIADGDIIVIIQILRILAGASINTAPEQSRKCFETILPKVVNAIDERWVTDLREPSMQELKLLVPICISHNLKPPADYVAAGWVDFRKSLVDKYDNFVADEDDIDRWLEWLALLERSYTNLWRHAELAEYLVSDFENIHSVLETEAELEVDDIEPDYLEDEARRIEELRDVAEKFYSWADNQSTLVVVDAPYFDLDRMCDEFKTRLEPEPEYSSPRDVQQALELHLPEVDDLDSPAETVESILSDL